MNIPSLNIYDAADQTLIGTNRRWQQTLYNDDTKTALSNADHYTLKLLLERKISIRAACNVVVGVYTLRGSELPIEITHITMAAPPRSLERRYIRDLNAAAIYFMKDDALSIDRKYDTGTMKFTP